MRKRSRLSQQCQREWQMVRLPYRRIVEWTFEGSLKTLNSEYGLSGTEPVINQECMLVHEKVDICQFEWYRDNKDFITVSNL